MNTQKIAITIPTDLVVMVDAISKQRRLSRSRFISMVLREKLQEEKDRHLKDEYEVSKLRFSNF